MQQITDILYISGNQKSPKYLNSENFRKCRNTRKNRSTENQQISRNLPNHRKSSFGFPEIPERIEISEIQEIQQSHRRLEALKQSFPPSFVEASTPSTSTLLSKPRNRDPLPPPKSGNC